MSAALDAAHEELYGQLQAAYRLDAEGQDMAALLAVLVPLEDVVDHARRVDLDTASEHYRADKAGALLRAAVRLQRNTLLEYARSLQDPDFDAGGATGERLASLASDLIDQVDQTVSMMWEVARGER